MIYHNIQMPFHPKKRLKIMIIFLCYGDTIQQAKQNLINSWSVITWRKNQEMSIRVLKPLAVTRLALRRAVLENEWMCVHRGVWELC